MSIIYYVVGQKGHVRDFDGWDAAADHAVAD